MAIILIKNIIFSWCTFLEKNYFLRNHPWVTFNHHIGLQLFIDLSGLGLFFFFPLRYPSSIWKLNLESLKKKNWCSYLVFKMMNLKVRQVDWITWGSTFIFFLSLFLWQMQCKPAVMLCSGQADPGHPASRAKLIILDPDLLTCTQMSTEETSKYPCPLG